MSVLAMPEPDLKLSTEVHLHQLPRTVQDTFAKVWADADAAADHLELVSYERLHIRAAELIGLRLPASRELACCTCQRCWCDVVFDAAKARTYLDGTVEFVQCPGCADDHRQYGE
ncbi:hypothetical protein ACFQ6Q_00205 [Streptomyces sp. NPDC056437]|uniref:hypothetical protein n=1 Tax=Streptomyces sp. NPDC056437 TaxID=3345816 RepID=UPI003690A517